MVEQALDARQVPAQGAGQVAVQVGVDVAAAGAHHHALQRGQAHAGVAALAALDGAGRAAVAEVRRQPTAVAHGQPGHLRRAVADVAVAGAVEAVAAQAMLAVQRLRQGIAIGALGQALVEGGVEHRHLRQVRVDLDRRLDAEQVGRVVQRRQRRGGADRLEHLGVDALRAGEAFAAVYHAVADAVQLAAGGALHQRQQLGEGGAVVGAGDHQAVLLAAALPAQHRLGVAEAVGDAAQGELRVRFVDQRELDRRAAAVDHQDVA
ncbi:hypothetical protein D9M69_460380 [compost metagenome]